MGPTVLITLALLPFTVSGMPTSAGTCRFGDATYGAGATFYPRVSDNGSNERQCLVCKCLQEGDMACNTVDCSAACSGTSQEDRDCCNICSEADVDGPAFRTHVRDVRVSPPAPCEHDGHHYRQGEKFTSNDTNLEPTKTSQCVQCICQSDTTVRCALEDCPRAYCDNPTRKPGHCCPVCPEESPSFLNDRLHAATRDKQVVDPVDIMEMGPFTVQSPSPRTGSDCTSGAKEYPNGATWHPVMGPFGRLTCDLCRCSAGNVVCSRVPCPKPTCARPRVVPGQCCRLCPNSKNAGPMPRLDRPLVSCVPEQRTILVWRSHGGTNMSQFIQYIFERQNRNALSEKHEWMLRQGQVQLFRVLKLDDNDISSVKKVASFKMLGSSNQNSLSKFHRRETALHERCKKNCARRVLLAEQRLLRPRKPKQRRGCKRNEIQVNL